MKLAVLDGESHGRPDFKREKTSTKSRLFRRYLLMFDVYTYVDNREKDHEQIIKKTRRISLGEKHENFIAVVRKWEILATSKERPAR